MEESYIFVRKNQVGGTNYFLSYALPGKSEVQYIASDKDGWLSTSEFFHGLTQLPDKVYLSNPEVSTNNTTKYIDPKDVENINGIINTCIDNILVKEENKLLKEQLGNAQSELIIANGGGNN